MPKNVRFAVGFSVILIALAYFAFAGFQEGKAYYKTIDELAVMGRDAEGTRLRVAGIVGEGTIERQGAELTFALAQEDRSLRVHYVGSQPVPDTFRDRAEAIVEGRVLPDGTFEADHIQAKCASKYEAKYGAEAQEAADSPSE